MARSRVEVRVGIFVFLGLTALCVMIILFGFRNVRLIHNTYRLTAVFQFTNGIVVGAPVRFAGVDVGKVERVEFGHAQSNDVYLRLSIRKGIAIRKDARLIINSLGVMGEKYLEFIPKSITAEPYREDDEVDGEEPMPLNDVVSEALKMVGNFRKILEETFDEKTRENIRQTIQNLRNLTDDETRQKVQSALTGVDGFTTSLQSLLKDNRENIQSLLLHAKNISESLDTVSGDLKESKGTLGLLISSPQLHESLHKTFENINAWITGVRKYGLLYKEKNPDKERPQKDQEKPVKSFTFGKR